MTLTEELLHRQIKLSREIIKANNLEREAINKRSLSEYAIITEAFSILQETCLHANIEVQENYTPGGYYDQSSTEIIHICTDCTKEVYKANSRGGYQ